jgi:hypothetical protein
MPVGIDAVKELLTSVANTACVAIKTVKKMPVISAELKDLDATEIVALVVQGATEELPKIIAELKK